MLLVVLQTNRSATNRAKGKKIQNQLGTGTGAPAVGTKRKGFLQHSSVEHDGTSSTIHEAVEGKRNNTK